MRCQSIDRVWRNINGRGKTRCLVVTYRPPDHSIRPQVKTTTLGGAWPRIVEYNLSHIPIGSSTTQVVLIDGAGIREKTNVSNVSSIMYDEEEKSCGEKAYDYTIVTVTCPCWCPLWFCFGLVNERSPVGCLPKCCDYLCYPCEYFWPSNTPMDQDQIRRSLWAQWSYVVTIRLISPVSVRVYSFYNYIRCCCLFLFPHFWVRLKMNHSVIIWCLKW